MGSVPCSRLTSSFPFKEITSDICGPFVCRGFVDSRKTRKVYILVNICHYTRYISLSLLESMNSEVLLQTIKMHSLRYGKTEIIHADFGSNYVGIKQDLEMESLDQEEVKRIQLELQSSGTQLVHKSPKTPWVQGSAEHAVSLSQTR